jgi:predicted PurR-regulated permease PerM
VGDSLLIFFTVVFLLVEASTIPTKIRAILSDPDTTLERLSEFLSAVKQYLVIKSLTSLITGVIVTAWLFFLGVDFAVLWGSIAFFMNFVPYVGSIIAAVPVVFLAFLDAGVQDALLVAVGFLAINLVVGNLIEPRFMGRGLGLSTLVVFVSLIFWGWVFGPVGMFLSAPLTMLVKIALENDPRSRWIAILLSSGSLRRQ